MQDMHNLLQNYLRDLLGGYKVEVEVEFKVPTGRIDLAGRREALSLGIEISRTSPVFEKDAKKLADYPFDIRFVVVDDPKIDTADIIIEGKQIKVVNSLYFQYEFRRALNALNIILPKSFISFDEWIDSQKRREKLLVSEYDLPWLENELKSIGMKEETPEILDAIAFIYTAGGRKIPVECINKKILPILRQLSIVSDDTQKQYDIFLMGKYINLAKQAVRETIKDNKNKLNDFIQIIGDRAYIIAKGTTVRDGNLKLVDKEHCGLKIPPYVAKDLIEIAKGVLQYDADREADLITRYCYFLTYSSLYDEAVNFFSELQRLNLVAGMPCYTSGGRLYDEYRAPAEVSDHIFDKAQYPDLDENAGRFGLIATIADCFHPDRNLDPINTRRRFKETLRIFGIFPEIAEEELKELNAQGITSKLIEKGEAAPFVVRDPEAFKRYLRGELEKVLIT
jgi:hypothetical protein